MRQLLGTRVLATIGETVSTNNQENNRKSNTSGGDQSGSTAGHLCTDNIISIKPIIEKEANNLETLLIFVDEKAFDTIPVQTNFKIHDCTSTAN